MADQVQGDMRDARLDTSRRISSRQVNRKSKYALLQLPTSSSDFSYGLIGKLDFEKSTQSDISQREPDCSLWEWIVNRKGIWWYRKWLRMTAVGRQMSPSIGSLATSGMM